MLARDNLLPLTAIDAFGAAHNAAVWEKHRLFLAAADASFGAAIRSLDAFRTVCGSKLTRKHVFDIADIDTAAGAAAAIIWGFPRGGLRGRWQPFAEAFCQAERYGEVIAGIREAKSKVTASEALARLNAVQPGIGFATTSKIAYFAHLPLLEGKALIYDSNVILAIKHSQGDEFKRTRAALGKGSTFYHRGTPSYGSFISEAETLSHSWNVAPEQIEAALFQLSANPRSGWN
ncbi:hypothetical protein ASF60_22195 [Methylobacterium sp. Leaf113]|uniref:8-oxoguanine DNA glycosylase OGG fold protein n=1 Tax=Methylobacterium sp. Leaf113 TaxID=1736259 RepID=UPI0006FEA280|nr:hypothetical protein [Methylobacterium sp. Leaf113]KQP81770.1 hypothetical protein ASF60_22195 [Methylobacterium sp. Leaf113]